MRDYLVKGLMIKQEARQNEEKISERDISDGN